MQLSGKTGAKIPRDDAKQTCKWCHSHVPPDARCTIHLTERQVARRRCRAHRRVAYRQAPASVSQPMLSKYSCGSLLLCSCKVCTFVMLCMNQVRVAENCEKAAIRRCVADSQPGHKQVLQATRSMRCAAQRRFLEVDLVPYQGIRCRE